MTLKHYNSIFKISFLVLFLGINSVSFASENTNKKFSPNEMIIEHIVDAHEWHVAKIGHTHISIPLPIILYDEGKIVMFCSSKFHHGMSSYKGYKLEIEGENKNKIVKTKGESMEADEVANLPLDFSITKNVLSLFISILILCLIFIGIAKSYKRNEGHAPKGLQSMLEPIILFIRDDIAKPSIGEKYYKFMPFLLTVFFFIFLNNVLGLIPFFPGGANLTGNIGVTGVLAVMTFLITTFSSNKYYWIHIVNTPGVPWWLKFPIPLMPLVEIMGVFIKPFVLMVRLFANISAGHIIALGFFSLIFVFGEMNPFMGYGVSIISVGFTIFMGLLELLVAFIQAYVFTFLSALYFGMAIESSHEGH